MVRRLRTLFLSILLAAPGFAAAQCIGWAGFQAPARYAVSADVAVLVRDLDGDGAPEILTSGNQVDELGVFSLLANRGDGTFAAETLVTSNFGEKLQDVGDLDHDGIPDLVVSNYWSNGITLYRGKGSLRFDSGTPYGTATHGGPSLITDYDHDGTPDVVSLSFGSGNPVRLHLFHGLGDGTFAPKTTIDTQLPNGETPSMRTINGALEILVGERLGRLAILHYAGGVLSIQQLDAGPGFDLSSTFADLNGDGVADIVETGDTTSENDPHEPIFITLARADGTFLERKQLMYPRNVTFPTSVSAADLDGDGHLDLVVSDFRSTHLYFYRGDGAGGFAAGVPIDAGGPVNAFAISDVNQDGHPDLVTANDDHTVSVLINRGSCPSSRRRAVSH
jgi:hypothetical protein